MTATISNCGTYRYTLHRVIGGGLFPGRRALFVMLNPSTADAELDDPTIRRCIGFAKREGFGALDVANLFAFRATDPSELASASDPVGPFNDRYVELLTREADIIVAAWGAHAFAAERAEAIRAKWASMDIEIHCLGLTKHGSPRHPLYVRKDAPMQGFPLGVAA